MGIINLDILRLERSGRRPELPMMHSAGAAAFDLRAFLDEAIIIPPGGRIGIPTGLKIALPQGCCALVMARSGLALKQGISLSNGVGLIDSDYRGEIMVGLLNLGTEPFTVHDGDRVAQLMVMPVPQVELHEAAALDETERGESGFGSSGIR